MPTHSSENIRMTPDQAPTTAVRTWILPGLLFVAVAGISAFLLLTRIPLAQMEGFAEEYVKLGFNLASTGSFSGGDLPPAVFRPPGYPFLIACLVKMHILLTGDDPSRMSEGTVFRLIFGAQAFLLAFSAVVLYVWLRRKVSPAIAFGAALLFGLTPYLQILTGFLHYEMLHIALVLSATSLLGICLERNEPRRISIILCGIMFGMATLTRPMTLILPPFILAGYLLTRTMNLKTAIMKTGLICAGMLIVIAPYTARNYKLTGRIIPVNAQSGVALWGATQKLLERAPNRYRWWEVWYPDGNRIYSTVTGEKKYNLPAYMRHNIAIEDEFKSRALQNLTDRPSVYLGNMARNIQTFLFDINSVMIGIFIANQHATHVPFKNVLAKHATASQTVPGEPYRSQLTVLFDYTCRIMLVFTLGGIAIGLYRRDRFIIAPLMVLACFVTAHAVSYMDLLYYYIKMPFLFFFSAYFLSASTEQAGGGRISSFRIWAVSLAGAIVTIMIVAQLVGVLSA